MERQEWCNGMNRKSEEDEESQGVIVVFPKTTARKIFMHLNSWAYIQYWLNEQLTKE